MSIPFYPTFLSWTLVNSIIESTLSLAETDGFIDTSHLQSISTLCTKTKRTLVSMIEELPEGSLFPKSDLDFWVFKIDELKAASESRINICRIHDWISGSAKDDREVVMKIATDHDRKYQGLEQKFKELWYRENRDYSYRKMNKIYQTNRSFWKDISHLIDNGKNNEIPQYKATTDKYFTYWLSAGPFDIKRGQNIHTDYFRPEGGERKLVPSAVDFYPVATGKYLSWKKVIGQYPDWIDMQADYLETDLRVFYLNCQVYTEEDYVVNYEIRYEGPHKVMLNGALVGSSEDNQSAIGDGELRLNKGRNNLILKLATPITGAPKLLFFLPGQKVSSNKYRYYISADI